MKDEDKEFWIGRPENREAWGSRMREGGWRPWLIGIASVLAVWIVVSLIASLADSGDGIVFVLP